MHFSTPVLHTDVLCKLMLATYKKRTQAEYKQKYAIAGFLVIIVKGLDNFLHWRYSFYI